MIIFGSRWLQLPLYLGLIVAQCVYIVLFLKELWHLSWHAIDLTAELPVSPAELAKNVELAQALTRVLAADGLNAWLAQAP